MIIKAAPSHRFISCQQGKKLLCTLIEEQPIEIAPDNDNNRRIFPADDNDAMSADKIKHFYITVSVILSSVLLLLIMYGCYTYRQ